MMPPGMPPMNPIAGADVDLPLPFFVDSLTMGERKQIADSGGQPDDWIGIRVPLAQLMPQPAEQAAVAIVPWNRRIVKQSRIMLATAPPPLIVGPSHLRVVIRRADLHEDVQAPPIAVAYGAVIEASWPTSAEHPVGRISGAAGRQTAWFTGHGAADEWHTSDNWLTEAEAWARAWQAAGEIAACGGDVRRVAVQPLPA